MIITEAIRSVGSDPAEFNINRDSIRRERIKPRALFVSSLHEKFSANIPLTVHWDRKLTADLTLSSQVDCLAILVSGQGVKSASWSL